MAVGETGAAERQGRTVHKDQAAGRKKWASHAPCTLAAPTATLCLDKDLNNVLETQSEKYEQDQKLRNDVSYDFIN